MARVPYILSESANLSVVNEPLRNSRRIKYTCFDVSDNFLVFGASSGGLYVFRRDPCSFVQLLPSTNGSVSYVSISPCETLVAFSTVKGSVSIVGFQSSPAPRFKRTSHEYDGSSITSIQWSARSSEVYIGDSTGRISVIGLLYYMLSHVILMQLDSQVVQMDWHFHLLLVSTLSRSYLCDTIHEQYRQIGSQLRDGPFGACFYAREDEDTLLLSDSEKEIRYSNHFSSLREGERLLLDERLRNVKVYCSRPGLRLWEVRMDGTVLNTLQLKRALAIPSTPVINLMKTMSGSIAPADEVLEQSFNFSKLFQAVDKKFLLAFHSEGFYLLDPTLREVVVWSNDFRGILDLRTVRNVVYLWCSDGSLHAVEVCPLDTFLIRLYVDNNYSRCASVIAENKEYLTGIVADSPKLQFLSDFSTKIKDQNVIITKDVADIIDSLANIVKCSQEKQAALKLESGIFLVGNDYSLNQYSSELKQQFNSYRDALLRKQKIDSSQRNGSLYNKKTASNGSSLLKVDQDLRASSRDGSDAESSVDDLDDILQILGITGQEMKFALKEMGNTITGTFTNSTKSMKKNLLSVMNKQKNWMTPSNQRTPSRLSRGEADRVTEGRRESLKEWKETRSTRIHFFIRACENVSHYKAVDEKPLEQYVFDLMESLLFLCDSYGFLTAVEINDIVLGRRTEPPNQNPDIRDIFSWWLKKEAVSSFAFSQIFSEEILSQVRTHLHSSLKSGALVSWIHKNLPDERESGQGYPVFMRNIYNEHERLTDRLLSRFLKVTASLLDPFIILQCLSVCGSPCILLSWNQVMELCQEGKLHRDKNRHEAEKENDWPLPITLNAILIMLDFKQLEYCKAAPTKDILYTILRLESKGMEHGKSESIVMEECGELFVEYLNILNTNEIIRSLHDVEIRTYLFMQFERLKCFQNDFDCCACGFPKPVHNDELEKHRLPHRNVCKALVQWMMLHDREKLNGMARRNLLLWPFILSERRTEGLEAILPIIIQMGDFRELEYRSAEMRDDHWSNALKLCVDLSKNKCLNCERFITESADTDNEDNWKQLLKRLLELLLRKNGPAEATRLLCLNSELIPRGMIDENFMKLCAVSALLDPTSGVLSRYALDSLSVASQKIESTPAFSPLAMEKIANFSIATDVLSVTSKSKMPHHWGVRLNVEKSVCPCCLLPLGSSVLLEKGGIAVFRCSHAFHTVCWEKRAISEKKKGCPFCSEKICEAGSLGG